MKCHYEVLQVERDADDDQIKKNYRKLALKWHPDKNPDNVEECTQQFRLLQAAYDVLSDVREREFYDRHRESILKGKNSDFEEQSVDLFPYFSAGCYQGYGDDKNGFYAVYERVFRMLVTEEYDPDDENPIDYPDFGNKDSDPERIVNVFYGFWTSFSTSRSYAWLDHYDITQASNRYESRQIDMENKKYRDRGKAERNDQIRELATFVRKRDPRVKAYRQVLEQKKEEALQKQKDNRRKQLAKTRELVKTFKKTVKKFYFRMTEEHLKDEKTEADFQEHMRKLNLQMAEDYDTCSDECDEEGEELPYCVVCSKSFKTVNAKLNHENSKQHIKQLNELKKHLKDEDATLFAEKEEQQPTKAGERRKNKRKDRKKGNGIFGGDGLEDVDEEVAEIVEKQPEGEKEIEERSAPAEVIKKEKKKRRADKTEKSATADLTEDSPEPTHSNEPKSATCDKCRQEFESKTKLFAHLKETGHATLLVNKSGGGGGGKKAKNKKGQRGNKNNDDGDDW
ncbi:Protein CBR-DNJ-17 [Caenorhabditis briggsae]|uniref:DnaJ homolog subfamily C member 21 n=1 Tax=Caenorhabditis briggsae TaxID=6238 RepID=A8X3U8_CAEBR|nr:Protein CBR-DNJ-17 [Caenorhabditis briggsae]CAP27308.2 Protein CBR-DNJ-17 [Caenorhabditis briggsae]